MTREEILNMPAGRELEAIVAKVCMGWPNISPDAPFRNYKKYGGIIVNDVAMKFPKAPNGLIPNRWRPSTDIADAWEIVEKYSTDSTLANDVDIITTIRGWKCTIRTNKRDFIANSDTAPLAICQAALLVWCAG